MIANLQPYPEYKESGSRWLAAVPLHWEVRNLRTLIRPRTERNRADLPLLSVAREKGVFVRSLTDENENHNVIPEDLSNYKVARAGNLVINKMKAWQGSMGIAPCDGIVSPAYFVFDFTIANPAFGQILLRSKPCVAHFGQASDGVRVGQWDLTVAGMRQIPVLVPPPEEQAAMVRFLDYANGRLERAIRAKRKVIALLHEQKQAIIHRAVTGKAEVRMQKAESGTSAFSLQPSALPMKPSGIPWLGDIPKHWEVRRNSWLFDERVEKGRNGLPILVVSLRTGVTEGSDTDEDGRPKRLIADVTGYKLTERGDIAYNTMRMWQGAVGVVPTNGLVSPAYVVAKPRAGVFSGYFELLFRTDGCKNEINRNSRGIVSDRNRLYWDQFKRLYLPLPPFDEQKQIVAHIETETKTLNTAINRLEREIELLREYRTRLVADVVTGKLDVRPAARHLPAETEPPTAVPDSVEPADDTETEETAEVAE